jgi:hypothetical protein
LGFLNLNKAIKVSSIKNEKIETLDDDKNLCSGEANYKIGQLSKAINPFNKAKVDLSISSPIIKYGISAVVYAVLTLLIVFITRSNFPEVFINIILVLMFITITIGTRKLLLQTSKISHLYNGNNHRILKNKILFALDKILLINCFVYVGIIGIISNAIGLSTNNEFLLMSTTAIILFGLVYYPLIIVYEEIPIFRVFPILFFVIIAAVISIKIFHNYEQLFSMGYISGYILACLVLRVFSQKLLWNTSYEKLIKQNH